MEFIDLILSRFNYWIYIILMMLGLYAMIAKNNLIKKLIGMSIFQTAIILFYVSMGVKTGATIPILAHHAGPSPGEEAEGFPPPPAEPRGHEIRAADYANPLPHVLMLTAIVVGVSTLGVALAVAQRIHDAYGTLEEDEIIAEIKSRDG